MAIFSSLRKCCDILNGRFAIFYLQKTKNISNITKRMSSDHRNFPLLPTKYQYHKFKDLLHFYTILGLVPIVLTVVYCNVFIGPATLSEIPEGYIPQNWEYYRHPITRFIVRYISSNPQQEYEKYLHLLYDEDQRAKMRLLEKKVKKLLQDEADYHAYYYVPYTNAHYARIAREKAEEFSRMYGDS